MRSNSEELQREEKETRTFQKTGGGRNRRRRRRPARGSLSALFVHPRRRRHGHLFFALDFKQPSSLFFVFTHWMPPHVYNNKSFRLASSCALYIIRLILTRALRSTVVGVLLSLFPSGTRRSGGSTLEEKLAGFFSREKPRFFSQTLNPKRKRKISKNSTVISKHTHTQKRA